MVGFRPLFRPRRAPRARHRGRRPPPRHTSGLVTGWVPITSRGRTRGGRWRGEHVGRDLGEGGPAATRLCFGDRAVRDLRRIGQAELRAIDGHEPLAPPKGLAVVARRCARAQRAPHQVGKDLPRQTPPTIGLGTVGQRRAEQLEQVVGQCPHVLHHMKCQGGQQLCQSHEWGAPATARQGRHASGTHQLLPRREKSRRRLRRIGTPRPAAARPPALFVGMCRHSQRKYRFLAQSTRGISISEFPKGLKSRRTPL